MNDQPHIAVLSLHPLFDTRVANHLKTLVDAGFRVTYVNWSRPTPLPTIGGLERVELIQHDADPAFGYNIARYMSMLRWFRRRTLALGAQLVHIHDLFLLPLATGTHASRIADQLKTLLSDPPRLAAMQSASARLGQRFSWGQVRGRYMDLYHRLGVDAPHAV